MRVSIRRGQVFCGQCFRRVYCGRFQKYGNSGKASFLFVLRKPQSVEA